jgi:Ca2+-binding EF-hand superfamily protein
MKAKRWLLAGLLAAGLSSAALAETPTATNGEWRGMIETLYQGMDANRDGMVSKQEFLAEMSKRFDKMDRSKKGVLNQKSIEQILAELTMRPAGQ